ncbi:MULTISPECIES: MFS transporter [Bifidobacterium]|uniref:MFS transporter n=1 Tax=Bifidobacterium TaxID=1678 RepID=UPI0016426E07|nr:MFS transporter [Bifidobacterium apousia]MBI0136180.1 MFS transporter [Bifidobacterium sp. W8120]
MLATTALTLASGTSLATQYAVQPTLGSIAADFDVSAFVTGQIITAVMAGYLIVLVLLVPLADRFSSGRLVPIQPTGLAIVPAAAASAPTAGVLIGVFGLVGVASTVAAEAVSVVGRFIPLEVRGNRVGIVHAGNSAGILLSRFVGGALTSLLGWRGMLACFATLLVATGMLCAIVLPRHQEQTGNKGSYFATLRALPRLLRISPALRLASATGMLWVSAFNLV